MLNYILFGLAILVQLILCFLVYYATNSNEKSAQKKLLKNFYLLSGSTILWSTTQSAYDWSMNLSFQGFILRLGTISTILTGLAFLIFTLTLVNKHRTKRDLVYIPVVFLAFGLAIFNSFFELSTGVDNNVVYEYNFLTYGFITLVPILLIARAVLLLINSKKHTKQEIKKRQYSAILQGMLISTIVAFTGNFLLVYLWGESSYSYALVAFTPVIFTASIVYSVFSLKMFNFRKFFTSILIYGAIFIIAYSTAFITIGYFADLFNLEQQVIIGVLLPTSLVLFVCSSWLARKLIALLTESNNGGYSFNQISDSLRTISSNQLLEDASEIIKKTLGLNKCGFIFITADGRKLWHHSGGGSDTAPDVELIKSLLNKGGEDLSQINIKQGLKSIDFDFLVPIDRQGLRGALLLGEKLNGRPIYIDEQAELKKVAFEVALGIENTLQFEKIKQFNVELEQKIEDATGKLRKTNEKLKALDEAKDEFISMASHQLRTPLTSIKGYISLILDGDMGNVPTKQRKMLNEAFSSSQRMVYLISDLLNVSRLKTGKFLIEATDVYLPDVVEDEIDQVKEMAEVKNIKIHYTKPKTFTHLELDDMKIRQVIMNFIDNAIHYTPEGGEINVELKESDKSVEFRVIDSGIGVPKSEQHHLFTKFYRAGNARKARPDGTGLGLFMGKKVVVASGGSIIFNSEEDKGSIFGFIFPVKRDN